MKRCDMIFFNKALKQFITAISSAYLTLLNVLVEVETSKFQRKVYTDDVRKGDGQY